MYQPFPLHNQGYLRLGVNFHARTQHHFNSQFIQQPYSLHESDLLKEYHYESLLFLEYLHGSLFKTFASPILMLKMSDLPFDDLNDLPLVQNLLRFLLVSD